LLFIAKTRKENTLPLGILNMQFDKPASPKFAINDGSDFEKVIAYHDAVTGLQIALKANRHDVAADLRPRLAHRLPIK
jgi:HJR/Mrr/RecB family endonuclease